MARHDVDVARVGVGSREDARAVHPLALDEYLDQMITRVDRKRDGLETPVAASIAQIHLAQLHLLHGADKIAAGEVSGRLLEQAHQRVGFQDVIVHVLLVPSVRDATRRT